MGCSFDNFSTSWWDRSYVITLLILAWFIPLVIIFISHIGILYRVRHSNIKDMLIKKLSCALNSNGAHRRTLREAMLCSRESRSDSIDRDDLPHVIKRVSINFWYYFDFSLNSSMEEYKYAKIFINIIFCTSMITYVENYN